MGLINRKKAIEEVGLALGESKPAPATPAGLRASAQEALDSFITQAGFPKKARSKTGRWLLTVGTVRGAVGIIDVGGEPFLRADAAVMPLPSDRDLILPLYRELLELNDRLPGSARMSLRGGTIWVQATREIKELEPRNCPRIIGEVMSLADDLDDELIKKYGGTTKARKAPVKV